MASSAPKNKYKATAWNSGSQLIDLEVPSGQLCQVRRPGVTGLVKAGVLDSLDSLTGLVKTEHIDRVKTGKPSTPEITAEDMRELSQNTEKLTAAFDLMQKVAEYVIVQPQVLRPVVRDEHGEPLKKWRGKLNDDGEQILEEIPLPDEDRMPGVVYTDGIEPTDQIYIFQFVVGGVRDLEQFRKEWAETLGSLESIS
jgi:hypothetical protein